MSLFPLLSEMDIRHGHDGDESLWDGSFLTKLPAWGSGIRKWGREGERGSEGGSWRGPEGARLWQ